MPQNSHQPNPFPSIPLPIPIVGTDHLGSSLFDERRIERHLDRNAAWLQHRPRRSNEIQTALFPEYWSGGVTPQEARHCLNRAMWDAGYTPDAAIYNPQWFWLEGESLPSEDEMEEAE